MSAANSSDLRLQPLDLDGLASGDLSCVLIEAPAGFGKTFLLRRTAANISQSIHTFFVTCNRIPATVFGTPASELLSAVIAEAINPTAALRFEEVGDRKQPRLLVLDGLNEVAVEHAAVQRLLYQARVADRTRVLASQRPALTRAPPDGYSLGFLLPLDREFVIAAFGDVEPGAIRLLRIPLFFELANAENIVETTQADAVKTYLERCLVGLEQYRNLQDLTHDARTDALTPALISIGSAATEIYRNKKSTAASEVFFSSTNLFDEIGGLDQALAAGFVVRDSGLIRFRHQLFHDWAVAKYYFETATLLNSEHPRSDLDIATLSRQSTDALELLVQMHAQAAPQEAEEVVLKIYDWDYPAAATTLVAWLNVAKPQGPLPPPSRHLQVTTFSLIAEKGFDLFEHTVRRFETIRSSVDPVLAELLPHLPPGYNLAELARAVGDSDLSLDAPRWYESWVAAFSAAMPFEKLLELLQAPDGALGWTASNVLARSALDEEHLQLVVDLFNTVNAETAGTTDRVATIRWRLVHAVGRSGGAVHFLAKAAAAADVEEDVLYGTVRSLCSIALSSGEEVARSSIDTIRSLDAGDALAPDRVGSAILRCSIPAQGVFPPSREEWAESFGAMLVRHRDLERESPERAGAWDRRIEELEHWRRVVAHNDL